MTEKERTKIQNEIVENTPLKPHGRYILSQRLGKSRIVIELIKRDEPESILWVTPFSKLAEEDIPQEFEKWGAKNYLKKLETVTWASLNKIEGHYDFIIFDEEQFITENNISNILEDKLTYNSIISMTGTETEHNGKKFLYYKLGLGVIHRYTLNKAVDIGVLSDYKINVVMIPMTDEKVVEAGNKNNKFMTSEILNYNFLSRRILETNYNKFAILNRLRAIKNSPSKKKVAKLLYENLKGRKIMFCPTKKMAESLSKHVFHSTTSDKYYNMFQKGEIDDLTLVESGGIGSTYKNIEHLILCQADSNKNGKTGQKLARALVKDGKKPTLWILCLAGTQDEVYVNNTLKSFDENKVEYVNNINNLLK